jgi:hypothetical protein
MSGSWTTFNAPDTSSGTFNADLMLLLTDGSVLIHNGDTGAVANANQWLRLTPDQNGRYETGTWSGELNMQYARQWFASGVLRDGRVFAIGGEYSTDPASTSDAWSGETFDPQANTWMPISKPAAFEFVRGDCNGSVLADGRVLIGGASVTEPPSTWSKLTAIWDPAHDSWVQAGLEFGAVAATTKEDPFEEETFNLLPDGSVLVPAVRDAPKAQRYLPWLDRWIDCAPAPVTLGVGSINGALEEETGPTVLLPDGRAFAIGGSGLTALYTPPPASSPTGPGSWTKGPSFPADTSSTPNWPTLTALDAPACLLPHGRVVCMGGTTVPDGSEYYPENPVLLEFDPASAATTLPQLDVQPALPAGKYTWQCFFLILPTGQMLLSAQDSTLFLYTPDPATSAPNPAWKPAHIRVDTHMTLGHSYTVRGTQINGLSQGACYGDDGGMASNYPIVRLTHPATGQVVYARSHDFSTMAVATGTAVPHDLHSCRIDIPPYLAVGHWNLVVIANGIPSDPVSVHIHEPYDHHHEHQFVGKIERLVYDRFGEFEAFALESVSGHVRRFESHEPHIAELAMRARREHWRVAVDVDGDSHRPTSISLLD